METGNPKQVAVLGLMAVGAIGFLFSRMGGKSLSPMAVARAEREAGTAATASSDNSPLLVDPFSHPKLAPPKPLSARPPDLSPPPYLMTGAITGPLPVVGPEPSEQVKHVSLTAKGRRDQKPIKPMTQEPVEMALEATAGSSDSVAFISVAGADSQPFRPNDLIQGKIRLLRIDDGAIVLSGPKGELTIGVGERKRI